MSVNEVKLKRVDDAKLFNVKGTGPATNRTFAIGNEDHTLGNALRHVRY
jgi:DNA-directed RNA polymerase subunit L